ncbi:MAG: Protochlamydia outer membrane protein, partial [Chlamydiia bacterium]|nr:Protochlamydia outer membrane protein [Chlamydiia bacterium]
RAQWNAPFVGLRGARALNKKFQVFAEGDFLFAIQYNAHAYWNLKNLSFKQDSNRYKGYGYIGILGADYQLLKNLTLKTELQFSHFEAKGGINKSSSVGVPFRKAILTSYEARLGLNYAF